MKAGFPKSMLADMEAIYLELSCLGRKKKRESIYFNESKNALFLKNNNLYKWPKPKYRRPAIGDFGNLWKMKEVKKKKKRKGFWYSGGLEGSSASFSKLVLPKRHSGGS